MSPLHRSRYEGPVTVAKGYRSPAPHAREPLTAIELAIWLLRHLDALDGMDLSTLGAYTGPDEDDSSSARTSLGTNALSPAPTWPQVGSAQHPSEASYSRPWTPGVYTKTYTHVSVPEPVPGPLMAAAGIPATAISGNINTWPAQGPLGQATSSVLIPAPAIPGYTNSYTLVSGPEPVPGPFVAASGIPAPALPGNINTWPAEGPWGGVTATVKRSTSIPAPAPPGYANAYTYTLVSGPEPVPRPLEAALPAPGFTKTYTYVSVPAPAPRPLAAIPRPGLHGNAYNGPSELFYLRPLEYVDQPIPTPSGPEPVPNLMDAGIRAPGISRNINTWPAQGTLGGVTAQATRATPTPAPATYGYTNTYTLVSGPEPIPGPLVTAAGISAPEISGNLNTWPAQDTLGGVTAQATRTTPFPAPAPPGYTNTYTGSLVPGPVPVPGPLVAATAGIAAPGSLGNTNAWAAEGVGVTAKATRATPIPAPGYSGNFNAWPMEGVTAKATRGTPVPAAYGYTNTYTSNLEGYSNAYALNSGHGSVPGPLVAGIPGSSISGNINTWPAQDTLGGVTAKASRITAIPSPAPPGFSNSYTYTVVSVPEPVPGPMVAAIPAPGSMNAWQGQYSNGMTVSTSRTNGGEEPDTLVGQSATIPVDPEPLETTSSTTTVETPRPPRARASSVWSHHQRTPSSSSVFAPGRASESTVPKRATSTRGQTDHRDDGKV
ncbi:expressed unknown protein [Seminavis robusta]|uniref:Uncharacterized protein n=1 Tax=Seminavis robusta TaxID=568900 RepID=A0A9N8HED3_9STRA|nr:expressed unknown protein [Seminavis robusta]|eukprot:Sro510_g157160.1 n/a (716) ;mRNA; f:3584-5731